MNIILGRGKNPFEGKPSILFSVSSFLIHRFTLMVLMMLNMIGIQRIEAIRENSLYFYHSLKKLGFIVWGHPGSPIIPLLVFYPAKLASFSHEALRRGLAVVVVGYPATSLVSPRVRFCISASHTREQLDDALAKLSEIGDLLILKVSKYAIANE